MNFEWDENKNQTNIKKHGIDFREACYVFADPFALSMPDDEHSHNEDRWLLLGASPEGQMLLVVHRTLIRIILTKREQQAYNERRLK